MRTHLGWDLAKAMTKLTGFNIVFMLDNLIDSLHRAFNSSPCMWMILLLPPRSARGCRCFNWWLLLCRRACLPSSPKSTLWAAFGWMLSLCPSHDGAYCKDSCTKSGSFAKPSGVATSSILWFFPPIRLALEMFYPSTFRWFRHQ